MNTSSAILSSSPSFLVSKIARRLNVPLFAGTEYVVDRHFFLCDIETVVTGLEKRQIAERWVKTLNIDPKDTVAWSDSLDDLPLLEWSGKVIAVRPTKALKKVAIQNKWQIWSED